VYCRPPQYDLIKDNELLILCVKGSESVESYSARRSSVISQELRSEIVPLDKLLSSSYPDDHGKVTDIT